MPSPGRIETPIANAIWRSTPRTAPYPNEVRPRVTARRGSDRSPARYSRHNQTSSQAMTMSRIVPVIARAANEPV